MTINIADNSPRVSYTVAESITQTSFAVPFEFFDDADLSVYVDGTLKTLTTNYTVSGGEGTTGAIALSVTGISGGSTVTVTRSIALERTTDFPVSGSFNITALNTELDRVVAIAADIQDDLNRSLRLTDYDTAVSLVLPDVNTRKGKTLAFNLSTGAVESGPLISDTQTVTDASADIELLADIQDGTVATNAITNVNTIRTDVTTVAGISANVTTVAGISANINTVVTNIVDIQNAEANADAAIAAKVDALAAQAAAESAQADAEAALDAFTDTYLGAFASDPTLDNDGLALTSGDLYFNTTSNVLKVYNGSAWQAAALSADSFVSKTSGTGSAVVPSGTEAERDGAPVAGYLRFNSQSAGFEGYDGSEWGAIGGGGGSVDAIYENSDTIAENWTIVAGRNGMSTGPISVGAGITVTVESGARYVVI
jgi:hypothetical protein